MAWSTESEEFVVVRDYNWAYIGAMDRSYP